VKTADAVELLLGTGLVGDGDGEPAGLDRSHATSPATRQTATKPAPRLYAGRMRLPVQRASAVTALALTAVTLLGASVAKADDKPLAQVPLDGGELTLAWGSAKVKGGDATGYFVAHNTSDEPVQVVAITTPDAASVGWTTKRQVVTLEELFTTGSVCSPDEATQQAVNQRIRELRSLIVPAHGTLVLRRGTGSLSINTLQPTFHRGDPITVKLYLSGASVPDGTAVMGALRTA